MGDLFQGLTPLAIDCRPYRGCDRAQFLPWEMVARLDWPLLGG